MNRQSHWERVYHTKAPDQVSWYQPEPRLSLELIQEAAPSRSARIIDVGGGASTLVDGLLAAGYQDITVLDIASEALARSRQRLGAAGDQVRWLQADILADPLPAAEFDIWHDRAVFHFLTSDADRDRYVERVRSSLRPAGHVIVATFAHDGPAKCSGLPVTRYAPDALAARFGAALVLVRSVREEHVTPAGVLQPFTYCLLRSTEPASKSAVYARTRSR